MRRSTPHYDRYICTAAIQAGLRGREQTRPHPKHAAERDDWLTTACELLGTMHRAGILKAPEPGFDWRTPPPTRKALADKNEVPPCSFLRVSTR